MRLSLLVAAAAVAGCANAADAASHATFVIGGENMAPRLKIRERVEFDLAAYKRRPPKAGDIVLIRPPRGAADGTCGSPPGPPAGELCVLPAGGPEPGRVRYVTRVVAVGGDRISFRRGRVIRNGAPESRRGLGSCPRPDGCTYPHAITVPDGHVYLAGDNRGSSDDSRFWGALPVAQVLGRYVRSLGPAGD